MSHQVALALLQHNQLVQQLVEDADVETTIMTLPLLMLLVAIPTQLIWEIMSLHHFKEVEDTEDILKDITRAADIPESIAKPTADTDAAGAL